MFVAHGEVCHARRGTDNEVHLVPIANLRCDHEEADTRMLLHAYYAADHSQSVVIKSVDTDVFIIALALSKQFSSQLFFHTGAGSKIRTVNLHLVRQEIGDGVAHAAVGLHALWV